MAFKPIEIKGLDEALRKLGKMPENMRRGVARGLKVEAEEVMRDSKRNYVPVDTGVLRDSGFVERPRVTGDRISVRLGFGGPAAPYALVVHESPRAGKTGGYGPSGSGLARGPGTAGGRRKTWATTGQWKYLEIPLLAAVDKIKRVIQRAPGKAFEEG